MIRWLLPVAACCLTAVALSAGAQQPGGGLPGSSANSPLLKGVNPSTFDKPGVADVLNNAQLIKLKLAGQAPKLTHDIFYMPANPEITGPVLIEPSPLPGLNYSPIDWRLPDGRTKRLCAPYCTLALSGLATSPMPAGCSDCLLPGYATLGGPKAACMRHYASRSVAGEIDSEARTARGQSCRAAAAVMFTARGEADGGQKLRSLLPPELQAGDLWQDVKNIIGDAGRLAPLDRYAGNAALPFVTRVLSDYLDNCLEMVGPSTEPEILEALRTLVIFVRPHDTYGWAPSCHGVRSRGLVFTARHCLRDESTGDSPFTQQEKVPVGPTGQDRVTGGRLADPATLGMRAFSWRQGQMQEIKLEIFDGVFPEAYTTDRRVFAPGLEFTGADWVALQEKGVAISPRPAPFTFGEGVFDSSLLVAGVNLNALSKAALVSPGIKFSIADIVGQLRFDRGATCRTVAFEDNVLRHGCQTESTVSGGPVFLRNTTAAGKASYVPIAVQQGALDFGDGGPGCTGQVFKAAPNRSTIVIPAGQAARLASPERSK